MMPPSKKSSGDGSDEIQPGDQKHQRRTSEDGAQPRELLRTDLGKVVGGIDAARRFQALLAKTLRLKS